MIQDDETLAAFIEESNEHLDGIESDLLAIEEAGADIDQDLVNKVFRAVHSIKGGAGFLGLDTVKDLAHGAENVLNQIREKVLIPTPEIISHLLDAADTLIRLLNAREVENEEDISGILAALTSSTATTETQKTVIPEDSPPAHQAAAAPTSTVSFDEIEAAVHLFSIATEEITGAVKSGQNLFIIELDLIADVKTKGKTSAVFFKDLQDMGVFFGCCDAAGEEVDLSSDPEVSSPPVFILLATIMESTLLAQFLDLKEEAVLLIPSSELLAKQSTKRSPKTSPKTSMAKSTPPPSRPAPVAEASPPAPVKKIEGAQKTFTPESSLRVNVKILDNLMTLAGELVLTRNQLIQTVSSSKAQGMDNISQRLDLVTSELQEAIMSTRMQPVGNVFNKFKRMVRDLSKGLEKEINLIIDGSEVELDKTIIEAIGDPLTHLVRNSVDHGIETPDIREQTGKPKGGTLHLSAFHQGGHVIIEIEDDGAGIDTEKVKEKAIAMGSHDRAQLDAMSKKELAKLIFLPGLSTARQVTDVSGRGVGMDVVNANLTRIGGIFDIDTSLGKGTTISIKLPLTLAIIPSLVVTLLEERYAIPQVNMVELVRIPAAQVKEKIEHIGSALVMRLRGDLLPLIHLSDVLDIEERTYTDLFTEKKIPCRRTRIADRRSPVTHLPLPQAPEQEDMAAETSGENGHKTALAMTESDATAVQRTSEDRRTNPLSAYNILIVAAGNFHYGLIVDKLLDSEEIVVKPLGSHLRECQGYAGATIQGDGKVALILDVVGISKMMNLSMLSDQMQDKLSAEEELIKQDLQSLLIVRNTPHEQMAVPLGLVSRIEKIKNSNIETTGGRQNIQYRGGTLPLFTVDEIAKVTPRDKSTKNSYIVVFQIGGKEVGILVSEILDIITVKPDIDDITHKQPGIMGSAIIMDQITLLVDLYGIISTLMPELVAAAARERTSEKSSTILIVEDSKFFMNQLCDFVAEAGYTPLQAFDGIEALKVLENESVGLILTDIEMPNMDGLEMTERIRSNPDMKDMPIIAVTSVAGDAAEKRGIQAGVNEYMIKLDREKIINTIDRYLS